MDGYTGIRECFFRLGTMADKAVKSNTQSNCFRSTFIAKFRINAVVRNVQNFMKHLKLNQQIHYLATEKRVKFGGFISARKLSRNENTSKVRHYLGHFLWNERVKYNYMLN
jgi:cytochrome c-type biogenesis protein CcmE